MAKNHRWKDNNTSAFSHKNQTCKRCGVIRQWAGSPWKAWEYWLKDGSASFRRQGCSDRD
jgi:hypothetical protein